MTYTEALKILTSTKIEILGERDEIPDFCRAMNMAAAALRNKIPKKPFLTFGIYYCPVCHIALGKKNSKALKCCRNCGQALNWEEAKQ